MQECDEVIHLIPDKRVHQRVRLQAEPAPPPAPQAPSQSHHVAAASPGLSGGGGAGVLGAGYTPSRAGAGKAEGWEKKNVVEAGLQQQLANTTLQYGSNDVDYSQYGQQQYHTDYGPHSDSTAVPADVSFTDMYKAGVVPGFGLGGEAVVADPAPSQPATDNEEYEEYYEDVPSWVSLL